MQDEFTLTKATSQYLGEDNTPIADTIDTYRDYGVSLKLSSSELSSHPEDHDFHLGVWDKLGLMAIGTGIVCVTLFIVVCTVGPGCYIYNWISMIIA